jgi:hypothetical protein
MSTWDDKPDDYGHALEEIDRLRALEFATRDENERLRALNAELVAALKRLVADYEDVPDPTDADGQAVFEQARAAIAKAEGGDMNTKEYNQMHEAAMEIRRLRADNKALVSGLEQIINEGDDLSIFIARAAIAKATGEEQ